MRKFFVHNFGCRAAQADGAALEGMLRKQGMQPAGAATDADLVILNTCTVTATADDEVRQVTRRYHRENPEARILVTGCYAQRSPEQLAAIPGVHWVVGNSHKIRIPDLVAEGAPYHGQIHVGDIFEQQELLTAPVEDAAGGRSRPNLKIQDGCNNRCSFCIIPSVRGRSRSASVESVLHQVRALSLKYKEVVLSGINLGRWGRDLEGHLRLPDLVKLLLEETDIQRLRLSSVEPMDFSGALLRLMADSPRIAKHVHAPLQSGSGSVLRRMRRKYRPSHYEDRIRLAREWMPDAAIGADVMVGFTGETDEEFEESRRFIESLPFTYLHVFTYSERPGTEAAALGGQVPVPVRKYRNRVLRELAAEKNKAFRQRFLGRSVSAVTMDDGRIALTSEYLQVELAQPRRENELVDLNIGALTAHGLREAALFPMLETNRMNA